MPLTERDKRTLKLGGIVVGVLLLGFLLFNVLGGGEDVDLPPLPPAPTDGAEPTLSPTLSPTTSPVAVFGGRDPFSVPPVLVPPTSPGATGTTTTSPTSPGTTTSPTSPGTTTSPTTSPTQPGDGSGTNRGGDSIVLLDVFTLNGVHRVQVSVNGTVYDVAVGERFAGGRYLLRSVSGNCATFVRGDEAFTLCVSQAK